MADVLETEVNRRRKCSAFRQYALSALIVIIAIPACVLAAKGLKRYDDALDNVQASFAADSAIREGDSYLDRSAQMDTSNVKDFAPDATRLISLEAHARKNIHLFCVETPTEVRAYLGSVQIADLKERLVLDAPASGYLSACEKQISKL